MTTVTERRSLVAQLPSMSFDEVNAWIAEREQPLCDELAALEDMPLTAADRRARRLVIRDERAALWEVRALWRQLHAPDPYPPPQTIG